MYAKQYIYGAHEELMNRNGSEKFTDCTGCTSAFRRKYTTQT